MTKEMPSTPLVLPCLRGQVQDWVYYVTLMRYVDVGARFKPAEEIHKNKTLNELLQRALTSRSVEISDYILNQKQHFFNAIIAGIYEGEPRWIEISIGNVAEGYTEPEMSFSKNAIGVLELSGLEKIFAIDGQHRVEGIKAALEQNSKHNNEECTIIFVAHSGSKQGLERTRRLFTTLNRYAKPVKLGEIIALDEDDSIAILTRRLLYYGPFFDQKDVVATAKTKNLPTSDKQSLTSIQALYDFLERVILGGSGLKPMQIVKLKMLRRPNEELDKFYSEITIIVHKLVSSFVELKQYFTSQNGNRAEMFRGGESGGSLVFRPIGFSVLGDCIAYCKLNSIPIVDAIQRLAKIDRTLNVFPWAGLLFDAPNAKMRRATKTDLSCATFMWLYMASLLLVEDVPKLVRLYADAHEIDPVAAKRKINKIEKL